MDRGRAACAKPQGEVLGLKRQVEPALRQRRRRGVHEREELIVESGSRRPAAWRDRAITLDSDVRRR
jgi:hypothetical protein